MTDMDLAGSSGGSEESKPEVIELEFQSVEEMDCFNSIHPARIYYMSFKFLVTKAFLTLWEMVCVALNKTSQDSRTKSGIWITGPKGTGKTTALVYSLIKLREFDHIHTLVIGPDTTGACGLYLRKMFTGRLCKQFLIRFLFFCALGCRCVAVGELFRYIYIIYLRLVVSVRACVCQLQLHTITNFKRASQLFLL